MTRRPAALLLLAIAAAAQALSPGRASAQWIEPSEPAFWMVSGAVFVVSLGLDEALRRENPDRAHRVRDALSDVGYGLGGRPLLVPAFAATLTVSHLTGWPAESERLLNAAVAVVAANVVTEGLKTAVGRGRPRHVTDPHTFRPFGRDGWMSFPSGHATTAFATAAALTAEFDLGGFEPVAWTLAGLVAWSRVYDDAHWASDTVAGGIVGIAAASTTMAWLHARGRTGGESGEARLELGLWDGAPVVVVRMPAR